MTRSKAFLAGTTCLLAIAGVAATKAHSFGQLSADYYNLSAQKCVAFGIIPATAVNSGSLNIYKGTVGAGTYTFYTHNTIRPCTKVVYTDAQ